ncbi:MAG: hypothetical protein ACRBN8_03225 [Nannocystales bacterium]
MNTSMKLRIATLLSLAAAAACAPPEEDGIDTMDSALEETAPRSAQACTSGAFQAEILEDRISPNGGYTVEVSLNGQPYTDALEYRAKHCSLPPNGPANLPARCSSVFSEDQWLDPNDDGIVEVPADSNFPPGLYGMQLRPVDLDLPWSCWDSIFVDAASQTPPPLPWTSPRVPDAVPGSYVVFENTDENGNRLGYSRFDYETDDAGNCPGGQTIRMTKTSPASYWGARGGQMLRWCIRKDRGYLVGSGGSTHAMPSTTAVRVTYPADALPGAGGSPALLGSYAPAGEHSDYPRPQFTAEHYSLLPRYNRIPANEAMVAYGTATPYSLPGDSVLCSEGVDCVGIGTWMSKAYAAGHFPQPSPEGTVVRMRYAETFLFNDLTEEFTVTEDWSWTDDGLVSQIEQWEPNDDFCLRPGGECEVNHVVRATAIEMYVPRPNQPLELRLRRQQGMLETQSLTVPHTGAYEVYVTRPSDGDEPYSGFLEVSIDNGPWALWRDASAKPIFVAGGRARIGANAHGEHEFDGNLRVRPRLTSAGLNAVSSSGSPAPNPIVLAASNSVHLRLE